MPPHSAVRPEISGWHLELGLAQHGGPQIPPEARWPTDPSWAFPAGGDGPEWHSNHTKERPKKHWVTSLLGWSDSALQTNRDASNGSLEYCAHIAVGMADGTTWVFRQARPADSFGLSSQAQQKRKECSASDATASASLSPSRRSRHHRDSTSHPPFVGFNGSAASQDASTSPFPPAFSGSAIGSTASSAASAAPWRASSSPTPSTSSNIMDSLESRLEAQYHSGSSSKESGLGHVMDSLGLHKHSHSHVQHLSSAKASEQDQKGSHQGLPAPSAQVPAPDEVASRSTQAARMSQGDSQGQFSSPKDASGSVTPDRRMLLSQSFTLKPAGEDLPEEAIDRGPRSIAASSRASVHSATHTPDSSQPHDSDLDRRLQKAEDQSCYARNLWRVEPLVRLSNEDCSRIACVRHISRPFSALLILQVSGLLSLWSSTEFTALAQTDLSRASLHRSLTPKIDLSDAKGGLASSAGSLPSTTNPLVNPLATFAALRSHTSSPVPGMRRTASGLRDGSRPSSPTPKQPETFHTSIGQFSDLQCTVAGPHHIVACLDVVKKCLFLLELASVTPLKADLRLVGLIQVPELTDRSDMALSSASDDPCVGFSICTPQSGDGVISYRQGLAAAGETGKLQLREQASAARTLLVEARTGAGDGRLILKLLWPSLLLALKSNVVRIYRIEGQDLSQVAEMTVDGAQDVELHRTHSSRRKMWVTLRGPSLAALLGVIADKDNSQVTLTLRELPNSLPKCSTILALDSGDQEPPMSLGAVIHSQRLTLHRFDVENLTTPLWESARQISTGCRSDCLLPLSMDRIVVLNVGQAPFRTSLRRFIAGLPPAIDDSPDAPPLKTIEAIAHSRSPSRLIIGGFANGDVAFWDSNSLALLSRWSLSTTGITYIAAFGHDDNTLRLHGCIATCAEDGTVGVILLDGFKLLFHIPGRGIPVERMAVRADEMLVIYRDERARVWDMTTQELRRSIGVEQALALLDDGAGAWTQHTVKVKCAQGVGVLSRLPVHDTAEAFMTADLSRAIDAASRALQGSDRIVAAERASSILTALLLALWPSGIDPSKDSILRSILRLDADDMNAVSVALGFPSHENGHTHIIAPAGSSTLQVSGTLNASRLTALTSMLSILGALDSPSSQGRQAHALSLWIAQEFVGNTEPANAYVPLDLAQLALHLNDRNEHTRRAASSLFSKQLRAHRQEDIDAICAAWRQRLPAEASSSSFTEQQHALTLLGRICIERFTSLDPVILKEVSSATSNCIVDATNLQGRAPDRDLLLAALTLCLENGFAIWQQYVDAMTLLRAIATMAVSSGQGNADSAGPADTSAQITNVTARLFSADVRSLARQAILHIAVDNTALLMTTLHLSLLPPPATSSAAASAAIVQSNSVLRLITLLVHHRPKLLLPSLPRLAETVVKSLDPTSPLREGILESATRMFGEMISAYPSLAFYERSQRIAIGTHEGAIILYDLRTATRLFVLEGHRGGVDAVSFSSGDGRRLVSVSLAEGKMMGWKVGSSISGFFNPGAMPKQGGDGASGGSYKSLQFASGKWGGSHLIRRAGGVEGEESATGLPKIRFHWSGDRNVRVDVEDVSFTFNVA